MTSKYRRVSKSKSSPPLTGLELIGCLIAVALFLLALFMIVMAVWATFSSSMRAEAKVTTGQAWTASLVAAVLFSGWVNVLLGHLSRNHR